MKTIDTILTDKLEISQNGNSFDSVPNLQNDGKIKTKLLLLETNI